MLEADSGGVAKLSNEYATSWLDVDRTDANGPRLRIRSLRDHGEVLLDPHALALLCNIDHQVLGLLADIARDPAARGEFADWIADRAGSR